MIERTQAPRRVAALAFGVAGLLLSAIWFLPILAASHRLAPLTLFVGLPGLAAGFAGWILGAPLLDPTRCRSGARAALRGAGIALTALAVFAPLLALGIKWTEPGWTNPLGLAALILWFGVIAVWWVTALVGALVGWLLWRWARLTP